MSRIGRGPGALRRWGSVLGAVAALVAAPPLLAALPARAPDVAPETLLARIEASADVAYTAYAESSGRISLPEVRRIEQVLDLLGETTRLRVWWRDARTWRVDTVEQASERGLYHDSGGTTAWNSGERRATRVVGEFPVRLPRTSDILPPELGRRMAASAGPRDRLVALPGRRVAGRVVPGVRIVPTDPATTVGAVDIWADAGTGLPVFVSITERGAKSPTIVTRFLELALDRPRLEQVTFVTPPFTEFSIEQAPDYAALIDQAGPWVLPDVIASKPRHGRLGRAGGTYGDGFAVVGVMAIPERQAQRVLREVQGAQGALLDERIGRGAYVRMSLLSGIVLLPRESFGVGFVVSGAVTRAALEEVAADLARQGASVWQPR